MADLASVAIRMTDLEAGRSARLLEARVDGETRAFLRSLGLTDRARVRVCKRGEPLIIQVRTTRIGLSRAVGERLYVVPEASREAC